MGMDAALTMGGRSGLNSHDWVKTLSSSSITYPIRREQMMRRLVLALVVLGAAAISTQAQNAIPDLKGTWSGKGKALVFGTNPHHPGSQTATDAPRVRDIEATYTVEGQEGRLVWGRSASTAADTKEPFAWAIASDNKTIVGADMDGYFRITLVGPNRMEKWAGPW